MVEGTERIILCTDKKTPNAAASEGEQGEYRFDSNFIYICVAPNTWKRAAIATW